MSKVQICVAGVLFAVGVVPASALLQGGLAFVVWNVNEHFFAKDHGSASGDAY